MPLIQHSNSKFANYINKEYEIINIDKKKEYFLRAKHWPKFIAKKLSHNKLLSNWLTNRTINFISKFNSSRLSHIAIVTHLHFVELAPMIHSEEKNGHDAINQSREQTIINNSKELHKIFERRSELNEALLSFSNQSNFHKLASNELSGELEHSSKILSDDQDKDLNFTINEDALHRLYQCTTVPKEDTLLAVTRDLFPKVLEKVEGKILNDFNAIEFQDSFYKLKWSEQVKEILSYSNLLQNDFIKLLDVPPPNIQFKQWYEGIEGFENTIKNAFEQFSYVIGNKKREFIKKALENSDNLKETLFQSLVKYEKELGIDDYLSPKQKKIQIAVALAIADQSGNPPQDAKEVVLTLGKLLDELDYTLQTELQPALFEINLRNTNKKQLLGHMKEACETIRVQREEKLASRNEAKLFIKMRGKFPEPLHREIFQLCKEFGVTDTKNITKIYDTFKQEKDKGFTDNFLKFTLKNYFNEQMRLEEPLLDDNFNQVLQNSQDEIKDLVKITKYREGWEKSLKETVTFVKKNPAYSKPVVFEAVKECFLTDKKINKKRLVKICTEKQIYAFAKNSQSFYLGIFNEQLENRSTPLNETGKLFLKRAVEFLVDLQTNQGWSPLHISNQMAHSLRGGALRKYKRINSINKLTGKGVDHGISQLKASMLATNETISLADVRDNLKKDPSKLYSQIFNALAMHIEKSNLRDEEIESDIQLIKDNAVKFQEAKDAVTRIFRKLFPDDIVGISGLFSIRGESVVSIPLVENISKIQKAINDYKGPVADRVELDKIPWEQQITQLIMPKLIIAIKDARNENAAVKGGDMTLEERGALTELIVDQFPSIINPGFLQRLFISAIGKYPTTISKIAKRFQKLIIRLAGKGLSKSIEDTKRQAKESEKKLQNKKPKTNFERNQIENDDFLNQVSLGFFELFYAAYEPFIKFGIRALPQLLENHDIKKHLPLIEVIYKAVMIDENPDWDKVQNQLKKSLIIVTGELQQYDDMINDLVKGILSAGK